jgi:hypothetical protein
MSENVPKARADGLVECFSCKAGRFAPAEIWECVEREGQRFTCCFKGKRCDSCGLPAIEGTDMAQFERMALARLERPPLQEVERIELYGALRAGG